MAHLGPLLLCQGILLSSDFGTTGEVWEKSTNADLSLGHVLGSTHASLPKTTDNAAQRQLVDTGTQLVDTPCS